VLGMNDFGEKVFHKNCGKVVEKLAYFQPNARNF